MKLEIVQADSPRRESTLRLFVKTMSTWLVYLIQTKSGKIYTGITNDLERRFEDHRNLKGARFFRFSEADKVVYHEYHPNRSEATKREIAIKRLSRKEKLALYG